MEPLQGYLSPRKGSSADKIREMSQSDSHYQPLWKVAAQLFFYFFAVVRQKDKFRKGLLIIQDKKNLLNLIPSLNLKKWTNLPSLIILVLWLFLGTC